MRTMLEIREEMDRCEKEIIRRDLEAERWARAFLAGASAMADWTLGRNGTGSPRPSQLTRPDTSGSN